MADLYWGFSNSTEGRLYYDSKIIIANSKGGSVSREEDSPIEVDLDKGDTITVTKDDFDANGRGLNWPYKMFIKIDGDNSINDFDITFQGSVTRDSTSNENEILFWVNPGCSDKAFIIKIEPNRENESVTDPTTTVTIGDAPPDPTEPPKKKKV